MIRIIAFLLLLTYGVIVNAQTKKEETAIKETITTFFDGLHTGDSAKVSSTPHKNINVQSTGAHKNQQTFIKTDTKNQLLTNIAEKPANRKLFEKLLTYTIRVDGSLASVWTPHEFYINNQFSHCGSNSFQLLKNNEKSEIVYLVGIRNIAGCKISSSKKQFYFYTGGKSYR